jgi:signal transduction histidine kinase
VKASILRMEIRNEQDVVQVRQRTRQIAQLIGFNLQECTRIATAVSEIARNAFQYAGGGIVEFRVEGNSTQQFLVSISDRGSGISKLQEILDGQYVSSTGMGLGILCTKRLVDLFEIESVLGQGTNVLLGKIIPPEVLALSFQRIAKISQELIRLSPQSPFEEIHQQNQELLQSLAALRKREEELTQLNRELEDTNRGVVALYAELEEKAESLRLASEIKTSFLSNMSHEFRTPLNAVLSLSRMLLERVDGELTSAQEKQVMLIRKSAEELTELINNLLDLAKVEAGKIEIFPSMIEVSELFGALRSILRPLLAYNTKVKLTFEEPTDVSILYSDESKLAQILRNLISNAIKYTEQGEVTISAKKRGDRAIFSVADTGIGIALEDQERIFEEFVQIESHLQKRTKGTGLGLAISRKLAELLGGSISLSSNLGVGSIFDLSIPLIYLEANTNSDNSSYKYSSFGVTISE